MSRVTLSRTSLWLIFVATCTIARPCAAQVSQVLDISPGAHSSSPNGMVTMGNVAYFIAGTPTLGTEVWRSDGTPAGTYILADVFPGASSSMPAYLMVAGNRLFFAADDGTHGKELWTSDGTPGGTQMVLDISPGTTTSLPSSLTALGNQVFFRACTSSEGCELWKSDGTAAGTVLVKDIRAGASGSFPRHLVALGNSMLFAANDGVLGEELWKSDGTMAGTVLVKNIDPAPASDATLAGWSQPKWLTTLGNQVLFFARTGTQGWEVWKSDGTTAGTVVVRDLVPGSVDGAVGDSVSDAFFKVENLLFFQCRTGSAYPASVFRTCVTDGTFDGTRETGSAEVAGSMERAALGGWYYYAVGSQVWRTDLAAQGPSLFRAMGNTSSAYNPKSFRTVGSKIFFSGWSSDAGLELWTTDGTVAGTVRVSDINPGTGNSSPYPVYQLGDYLLFTAGDAVTGMELWSYQLNRAPIANAGSDQHVGEGEAASLDGSASSDPDSDPLTYEWRDENGVLLGTTATLSVSLAVGIHDITLTVSDGERAAADTTRVRVGNQIPVAVAAGPYTGIRNAGVAFDGTASSDPESDPLTYVWDFGDGSTGTGVAPVHAYATLGTFTVTLIVNDGAADSAPATADVTIVNQLPIANAGGPYTGVRNGAIGFSGAASSDADGDALTHLWNFGDGATGTGVAPTHAYATAGTFTVTLIVNDGLADSAPAAVTVTITNQIPIAIAGGPYSGVRNSAVAFNATASSDPEGDPLTYVWNFGDGSTGTGVAPVHVYATLGTFTVTLTVNDGAADSAPVTTTVTITNQAPSANAGGPYTGLRNSPITLNGAASTDLDGDPLTYLWSFGDGATGTGVAPAHAYATGGTFTVTLIVNDGLADSAAVTAEVTVTNQAPAANPGGPYAGTRLAAVSFSGAASSDPEGDTLTYAWDFGDGSAGTGATPGHLYTALGTFSVTLIVNDGSAASAPVTTTVLITNVAPSIALTSPASGSVVTLPANITVTATAADQDGAVSVIQFYAGGTQIGQATSAPYAMTWSGAPAGTYSLTAVVIDDSGAAVTSAPVSVIINAPPSVVLTSPAANAQFGAPAAIALAASASDSDGLVTQVEFFQGATSLGIDTSSPYAVVWSGVAPGSYVITAVARDNLGAVVSTVGVPVKVTATLSPSADAFVRSSTPNANLGTTNTMVVHWGTTSSNQRWAYLKFDLASVPSIADARLRVFGDISGTTSNVIQTAAYPVADTSWAETGITWNNKPPTGASALSTVTIVTSSTTPRWYELDVTAYLQAEKAAGRNVVTLALKNVVQSTQFVTLNSKEATADKPVLFVVP